MSINSNTLFQSVGKVTAERFLIVGDESNNPSIELSANDITSLMVNNKIIEKDISFTNISVKTITQTHTEKNFIKDKYVKTDYDGLNVLSESQLLRIVDSNDQLILGATTTTNRGLLYSYNGNDWYDISSSLTSCESVFINKTETYIAVGEGPTPILYSYDGVYWNDASCNGIFTKAKSIAYGNGLYVAVGEGSNTIAYSYDGIEWIGGGKSIFLSVGNSVFYGNNMWVSCGSGLNTLAHSSDGINWTGLGNSIFTFRGNSVVYFKGKYVSVGEGSSNGIAYSSNGINWTGLGKTLISSGFSINYGSDRFIAGGEGPNTVIYSFDGINWQSYSSSLFTSSCVFVGHAGSTIYIVGGVQGTTVYTSENGITWTLHNNINFKLVGLAYKYDHSIIFPKTHMVAVGEDSSRTMSWSPDGITWNDISNNIFESGKVSYYNGKYWIAGGIAPVDSSYNLAYSEDGKSWTSVQSTLFETSVQGLGFDQTHHLMIACGSGSTNTLAYSYDYGLTWIGLGTSIFSISGNGVAHNGELWIAVGSGVNNTIAYSNDGLNWTGLGKTIFSTSGTAILYKNKMWVATGQGTNAIAYSLNGINWTNVVNTPLTSGLSVGYNGHKWLASGSSNIDVKKIRVRRVSQDNYTPNVNGINLEHISEIQMWVNGTNVATNGTASTSSGLNNNLANNLIDNQITGFSSYLPTVSLIGSSPINSEKDISYNDAGATAVDYSGLNITSQVVVSGEVNINVVGSYTLTYSVTDSYGVSSSITRIVNVEDTILPVITLNGDASVTIDVDTSYNDLGAIASDFDSHNLTSSIVVNNPVDITTAGTYYVTYNVTDPAGNTATEVVRTVQVNGDPLIIHSNLQQSGAFAALKPDGSVVTWGHADRGGDSSSVSSSLSSGVSAIYSTRYAFAALKTNGSVVTWGDSSEGGDSSSVSSLLSSGVSVIHSTQRAFAALKTDGSVVTWGVATPWNYGADSSSVSSSLSSGVSKIYSNTFAFAALKTDGSVVGWGIQEKGGDAGKVYIFAGSWIIDSDVSDHLTSGVTEIYSTNEAFAALKTDGSVVTWGLPDQGGDSSTLYPAGSSLSSGVLEIVGIQIGWINGAFAALKNDGSVVTWGNSEHGGALQSALTGVSKIYSNMYSFAALKTNGSVVTWGNSNYGGDSSSVSSSLSSGVSKIYSTLYAFAALKTDGSVVTWGGHGGDSSSVSSSLSSGVSEIYFNKYAFAAVKDDGSVVTWSHPNLGGDSSSVDFS